MTKRPRLGDFGGEMWEHRKLRGFVHLRLERMLVLDRAGANSRRTGADLVDMPLQVGQVAVAILA